ncbi:MAG TPA: tRNA guanosine(34) transglycosylase Tgt [Candidatus Saccharimonadales bacterium]|nr:tRNA guanosine(34) transglycosylase Tgt [Candidatus Saccharimonadales bacterium]
MKPYFFFEIIYQSSKSKARVGKIHTPHGIIQTPSFVAVGTNGTLKSLDNHILETLDQQLMFCNTYHMLLHPGPEVVAQAGGLHKFINRTKPIITDSGGFQVFSLAYGGVASELKSKGQKNISNAVVKINENGVTFRSYRNGDLITLTPESSVLAQKKLGADIIIPFDELPPYHIDKRALKKSLDRTHRWEKRSLDEHLQNPAQQAMYGVIHGGIFPELRQESCKILGALPFDGFAIGGSVGKNREEMIEMLKTTMPMLPYDKPNHLLGIGDLPSIESIIPLGIDTFDSSHPTKCARHGHLFTSQGTKKITQNRFKNDLGPIDPTCLCATCKNYSTSFLYHLFKAKEASAHTLATIHNISYMNSLMHQYREKILAGDL